MTFRILVTGSRNWTELGPIRQGFEVVLRRYHLDSAAVTVVHGAAKGAGTIAAQIAESMGMKVEAWPADWQKYGRKAGPLRNTEMVAAGADVCLAFPLPGSIGTHDCIRRAKAARIPTYVYGEGSSR